MTVLSVCPEVSLFSTSFEAAAAEDQWSYSELGVLSLEPKGAPKMIAGSSFFRLS